MKILLDTHYLLWITQKSEELTGAEKKILTSGNHELFYSPVSLWEVAIKYGIGKLKLGKATPDDFRKSVERQPFESIGFENSIISSVFQLQVKENHKDPFDRMLIWQTIQSEMVLLSRDKKFRQYIEDGLLLRQGK